MNQYNKARVFNNLRNDAHRLGLTITEDARARTFKVHVIGNGHGGFVTGDLRRVQRFLNNAGAAISAGRAIAQLSKPASL